jgi:NAD+ synthase
MDALMWGLNHGVAAGDLAAQIGLGADEIEIAYGEIERRRVATRYLHAPAVVLEVPG